MAKIIFRIPEEDYLQMKALMVKTQLYEHKLKLTDSMSAGITNWDSRESDEFRNRVLFLFYRNQYFAPHFFEIHPIIEGEEILFKNATLFWEKTMRIYGNTEKEENFENASRQWFSSYRRVPKEEKWLKNLDAPINDLCHRFRPQFEKVFIEYGLSFELDVPFNLRYKWVEFHELNSFGMRKRFKTVTDTDNFGKPGLTNKIKNEFLKELHSIKELLVQEFIHYINTSGDVEIAVPFKEVEREMLHFVFRFSPDENGHYTMNWKLEFFESILKTDILILPENK